MNDWEKLLDAMVAVGRKSTIPQPKFDTSKTESGVGTPANALTPEEYEQRIQRCGYDLIYRANVVHFLLSSVEGLHDTPALASLLDDCARSIESAENFPAVDAVPVVRCRECIHKPHYEGRKAFADDPADFTCPFLSGDPWESDVPRDDFYCAYGERKTEQNAETD